MIIYHNPACSKSRETLKLLQQYGVQPKIELYLEKRYTLLELSELSQKLGIKNIREMMRSKEPLYQKLELDAPSLTNLELLQILSQNIQLLERPIVVKGDKAKIGRPPENVLDLL